MRIFQRVSQGDARAEAVRAAVQAPAEEASP